MQDLNRNPVLPLDKGAFDAALCCVGARYLQQPVTVFVEVRRVLVAGAPLSSARQIATALVGKQRFEKLYFSILTALADGLGMA